MPQESPGECWRGSAAPGRTLALRWPRGLPRVDQPVSVLEISAFRGDLEDGRHYTAPSALSTAAGVRSRIAASSAKAAFST